MAPILSFSLNGAPMHYSANGSTAFVPLPPELWVEIPEGCKCTVCTANQAAVDALDPTLPRLKAYWDTMAIATAPEKGRKTGTTWLVHMPEARR